MPPLPRITLLANWLSAATPAWAQNVQVYGIADASTAVTKFDGQTTADVRESRGALGPALR